MVKQPLFKFLHWWATGLGYLVPDNLKQRLTPRYDQLYIKADKEKLDFRYISQDDSEEEWSMPRNDEIAAVDCRHRLAERLEPDTVITVFVREDLALAKPVSLPLAAADNLREVLGFEMDRQTPFHADQVYFDWREVGRNPETEKINIELIVVLKSFLEPLLQEIQSLQIQPRIITVDRPDYKGINLLPREAAQPFSQTNKTTWIIGAAALVTFFCALYLPLLRYEAVTERLETRAADLRERAKATRSLVAEKENILARSRFLENKRQERATAIDILRELTVVLPDDTWVSRLILRGEELKIHGESDTATAIIEALEDSKLFSNAQFDAPVTKNSRSDKDRYQVSATISQPEAS